MRGPLTGRLIQALAYSFPLEKKKLVRDLSIYGPLCEISRRKKSEKLDPRMRKCDEHQTLAHLDVHVYPVFVCVEGGGGYSHLYIYIYIYIYIYMKIPPKILKLKDFEPPKMV